MNDVFAIQATYEVFITDPFGENATPSLAFFELDYTRVVNEVGPCKITIPYILDPAQIDRDYRIYVFRSISPGTAVLDTETYWLVRKVEVVRNESGSRFIEVTAVSANEILRTRFVDYNGNSAQAKKTDQADDVLRAIVRENLGSSAIAARNLSTHIRIGSDQALGPTIQIECARENVMDVLNDVCNMSYQLGTPLFYDLVWTGVAIPDLEFRVYTQFRGQDRRATSEAEARIISPNNGTMQSGYRITWDYSEEITFTKVGGPGEEGRRLIGSYEETTRTTLSPYGRREQWVDAGGSNGAQTLAVLNDRAKSETRRARRKLLLEGPITPTNAVQYGRDWAFGDLVTAQVEEYIFDARISAVHVNVKDGGKETIEAWVRSDT